MGFSADVGSFDLCVSSSHVRPIGFSRVAQCIYIYIYKYVYMYVYMYTGSPSSTLSVTGRYVDRRFIQPYTRGGIAGSRG